LLRLYDPISAILDRGQVIYDSESYGVHANMDGEETRAIQRVGPVSVPQKRKQQTNPLTLLRRRRKQAEFLRAYRVVEYKLKAAKRIGVQYRTILHWINTDELFQEHVRDIEAEITAARLHGLETEAYRRAVKGVKTPLVSMGRVVAHVRKKSDTLMVKLLEAEAPEKYRKVTAQGVEAGVNDKGERYIKLYQGFDPADV
jgi:hypothetical protein